MPQEIKNPKKQEIINPSKDDTVTLLFASAKNVKCKLDDGSGMVTTDPQANIDGQTQTTWKFGFAAGEKKEAGVSSITKITITGKSMANQFTITSD